MASDEEIDTFADRDREVIPLRGGRRLRPPPELGLISALEAVADLRRMQQLPRYPTPWASLTAALGMDGWFSGQVYTLVGGTGVGKTTWALAVAKDFAEQSGEVIYVTDEMRPGHCLTRAAAKVLGVTSNDLIRNIHGFGDNELANTLPPGMFFMRRRPLETLRKAAEWIKQQTGKGPLIIVDYLGKLAQTVMRKLSAEGEKIDERRATTIASNMLCEIAEDVESPVVALSAGGRWNLSRLKGRNGKAFDPRTLPPGDLVDMAKDSGEVEYDSAGLLVLSISDSHDETGLQVATMTVSKARFGLAQHIAMAYDGPNGIWHDRGRVERTRDEVKPGAAAESFSAELEKLRSEVLSILALGPTSQSRIAEHIRRAGGKVKMEDLGKAVTQLLRTGAVERTGKGRNTQVRLAGPALPGMGVASA